MNDEWVSSFRHDPNSVIADLFSGRVGVGSSFRLDLPELLYQTFPNEHIEDRERLDRALLEWLLTMRAEKAEQVRRLGVSVYAKRLSDALVAIRLVDLRKSRDHIRTNLDTWIRWLSPLRIAPHRDPALDCWHIVTKDQPDQGFAAMWLRLAGDPRPEYFNVAWVGLKLLPNGGDARRNQLLMVSAAISHAATTAGGDIATGRKSFNRHLAVLRTLFPRNPAHWRNVLLDATEDFMARETGFGVELAKNLRPDKGLPQ